MGLRYDRVHKLKALQTLSSPGADAITPDEIMNPLNGDLDVHANPDGITQLRFNAISEVPARADDISLTTEEEIKGRTSDVKGALESLDDCQWLSDTAIELLLKACVSPEIRLFDSSYVTMQEPLRILSKSRLRLRNERLWIIPLNH